MSQTNVDILRRANALANAGAWDALLDDIYQPDAELRDLRHGPDLPEAVQGRETVRLVLTNWMSAYDEFGSEVLEYTDAQHWVVRDTRWHGRGRGSGIPIDVRGADAYEFKVGKICTAIVGYPDVASALDSVSPEA